MQALIVGWQVYQITKDPLSLGLIGLAEAVPFISIALYGGHVADIVNRKKIIIIVLIVLLLCSLLLLFFTLELSPAFLRSSVMAIYIVIFVTGIARGFIGPALFAFMPQIVNNPQLYGNAISWNNSIWQTGSMAGPAIGGLVYGLGGLSIVYLTVTFLMFSGLMLFTFISSKPLPLSTEKEQGVANRLMAGIKFVFKNQLILSAISLDLFAVLFGGAIALLPVFASEILKVGPEGLGLLRAAPGIGALFMVLYLAYNPIQKAAGKKMLFAVAGFGFCMIFFGLSTSFWLSMILMILSGALDSISIIVRSNLIHRFTPENMKGRVSAVNSVFIGSSNELGAFESGVMAKLIGVVPSVVAGGIITLSIVGITSVKAKKLRELNL